MRRAGYGEHRSFHDGQISYTRRLGGENYPRFHAYVEDKNGGLQINLHLDQKQSSIGSGARHGGEYDGPLVEREMQTLITFIQGMSGNGNPPPQAPVSPTVSSSPHEETPTEEKSGGLWGGLFGNT